MGYILLDVGNSFTKVARFSSEKIKYFKPLKTRNIKSITSLIHKFPTTDKILIASTHKNALSIKRSFRNSKLLKPSVIPIKTKYNIKQIGIDRLLSAFGALQKHESPIVVVSFGTAITIDFINTKNEFCGGIIYSGIEKTLKSLESINPKFKIKKINKPIFPATGTKQSLNNGIISSIRGMLNEFIKNNNLSSEVKIIFTGGHANTMKRFFKNYNVSVNTKLVFNAMKTIAISLSK